MPSSKPPAKSADASRPWFVYLLECRNGRLYTGITTDLASRFRQHCSGKGAMFTRINPPLRVLAATYCPDRSSASRLEAAIKRLPTARKRLAAAEWALGSDLPCLPAPAC